MTALKLIQEKKEKQNEFQIIYKTNDYNQHGWRLFAEENKKLGNRVVLSNKYSVWNLILRGEKFKIQKVLI